MAYPDTKILLIENNPKDVRIIEELLNNVLEFNFILKSAETLSIGLNMVEEEEFDVVLLDLSLPDSSGLETILRTKEKVKNIPIIILNGTNDTTLARKAVKIGAQDYLVKVQIDSNQLVRSIFHAIDRHKKNLLIKSLAKEVQKNEARLRKIIEMNADSILIVLRDGNIRFANPASEKFFGQGKKELIGKQFGFPIIEDTINEITIIKKGGEIATAEMQVVEIEWDFESAYLLSLRDISQRKKMENRIKESEKKYRDLFENSPYPTVIINLKGKIIDCNNSLEKLIEFKKDELVNRTYEESVLIPKEEIPLFVEKYNSLLKRKVPEPMIIKFRKKKNKLMWLKLNFSLMNFKNDVLIHILIQDVTEFRDSEQEVKELEQTLKEINALIENAPLAIFLTHQNGEILRVNEEAQKLFEYSLSELLTFKIFDLFDLESLDVVNKHYHDDIYNLSMSNKMEAIAITRDKKKIHVEVKSTILRIVDNVIIQSFFSDITERKDFEKSRQLLMDQLLASLEFKTQFLATMSHELRTPLNAVLGFSQLLLEESYGSLNEEQKDFLNDINSAGNHLFNLINSILDLSKIEAGKFKLNFKKFKLKEIVDEVKTLISPLYSKKGLEFIVENISNDQYLIADPLRFKQILFNLFSNANKFTEKGIIKFRGIERIDHWEFQVIDTGIGIAKKDYDVVFREFGRIENDKTKDVSGAGLGLAVTKRLVQLHGGDIWFKSELGKGTKFCFTISKKEHTTSRI